MRDELRDLRKLAKRLRRAAEGDDFSTSGLQHFRPSAPPPTLLN
jgi:hypothetical protein